MPAKVLVVLGLPGRAVLEEAVSLPTYGQLPTQGLLDELHAADRQQPYTITP